MDDVWCDIIISHLMTIHVNDRIQRKSTIIDDRKHVLKMISTVNVGNQNVFDSRTSGLGSPV